MHATTINMYISNIKSRILNIFVVDEYYLQVKEDLQQEKDVQPKYKEYKLGDDVILMH